ncbi:MAG TPA: AraD1 family protein, partial [Cyclobacteriaceae bacterium]|nr:AraD1 family protein [Cyclobacteriaceae bacterium]
IICWRLRVPAAQYYLFLPSLTMANIHIVQLEHAVLGRRVGIVEEPRVILLDKDIRSTYQLVDNVVNGNLSFMESITTFRTTEFVSYDDPYSGKSHWRMLPPIDCPGNPTLCMLSGTGLTHKTSADNRQKMHSEKEANKPTDSMIMYLWGEEGGKPESGSVGVQPEWFYKGNGLGLRGHNAKLITPSFAEDGGEEPEIAGIYFVSEEGEPYRVGFTQANEFSDHVMEKKNYLYLAPSKIRTCSIGPELIITRDFKSFQGTVSIVRNSIELWSKTIHTGEDFITHSLANLEHHHFKYPQHRLPGQLHIHFFGADAFSFGAGIALQSGDEMKISFERMGRPLVNVLEIEDRRDILHEVRFLV